MCKKKTKTKPYFYNVWKHKLEMKERRLWCKIILEIGVEQSQNNEKNYIYLYSLANFVQRNFYEDFIWSTIQRTFLNTFLITHYGWKWTMMDKIYPLSMKNECSWMNFICEYWCWKWFWQWCWQSFLWTILLIELS